MGYQIRTRFAAGLCLLILLSCTQQAPRSPFQGLEWKQTGVICYIDNQRYQLEGVGSVSTKALLESCKRQFGQNWISVFESDFDAVLELLNLQGNAVSLTLRSLKDSVSTIQQIPLLKENIQLIKTYRLEKTERINRPLPDSLSTLFSPAAKTFRKPAGLAVRSVLPAGVLLNDLSQIEWLLENYSIYLKDSLDVYRQAIDALRFVGQNGMPADDFYTEALLFFASCRKTQPALRIRSSATQNNLRLWFPFYLHEIGNRLAAFSTHNNALLNADHPYLVQINGVAIDQWLNAASDIYGFSFLDETRDIEIARVNLISRRFGVEPGQSVMLSLESADGSSMYVERLQATKNPANRPGSLTDIPKDQRGYISFSGERKLETDKLRTQLTGANPARALIFDLRQTGHLKPVDMALLLGLMMSPEAEPSIVATQQWRCDEWKDARSPDGFEPASGFFPLSYHRWNAAERDVIRNAIKNHGIAADSLHFSDPHFLLAKPAPNSLDIKQPVIWLTDHSSAKNAVVLIEAAGRVFKRSYHVGVPLAAPVGSFIKRKLASGAAVEITTSRIMNGNLSAYPARMSPDHPLFESPDDLLQSRQPVLRAVSRLLAAPLRTAGSY